MLIQTLSLMLAVQSAPPVAFTTSDKAGFQLFVAQADSVLRELGSAHDPVWSPDGSSLAYLRCKGPRSDEHTLMVWTPGKGEPRAVYETSSELAPVWSSDSKTLLVAFVVKTAPEDDDFGIFKATLVDVASGKSADLGEICIDEDTTPVAVPNSPNFLVNLGSWEDEETPHLWLVDSAGKKLKDLGEGYMAEPSPNGKYAAVLDGSKVISIDLATGARQKLAHCCDCESSWPNWMPDSSGVLVYDGAEEVVVLVSPTGTVLKKLPKGYDSADLDPTGRIAVLGGNSKACVYDLSGGRLLAEVGDYCYSIGWADDGKRYFYASVTEDESEDYETKLRAFDLVKGLTAFPEKPMDIDSDGLPEISSNGKWLIFPGKDKTSIYECATGKWRDLASKSYFEVAFCPK